MTRVDPAMAEIVCHEMPDLTYHALPRLLVLDRFSSVKRHPGILVVFAGTADLPVAGEAAITAELMNNTVERMYHIGVAGIHRLLNQVERLWNASVIIVVAGMDGALPSVVGGLVSVPVIAIPTSVGYDASFYGLAALLTMINSCATGVGVVNIDNGFGAGVLTSNIAMVLGNAEAICAAVEEELGIVFVSRLAAARGIALGRLVEVSVQGMELGRTNYLARNRRQPLTRAQTRFWEYFNLSKIDIPSGVNQ